MSYFAKKCSNCKNYEGNIRICESCAHYDYPITVFNRITASLEVLAPHFVYHVTSFLDGLDKPKKVWYSTLIQGRAFASETEAKRATVEKLKEVGK